MKKLGKWVGIIIGILILLAILLVISLTTFINPNKFKPLLAEKVQAYTGRELIIDGDLSWTFFPTFGVEVENVVLKNSSTFKQPIFAEIKNAKVSIKLIPLLRKHIESNGIELDGMKLHLIKNTKGEVNWNFNQANQKDTNKSQEATSHASKLSTLAILGINISNSEITWADQQKHETMSLENFNLHAKNINVLEPFPVTSDFDFNSSSGIKGHLDLKTDFALNVEAKIYSLRELKMDAILQKNKNKINLVISGDVMVDLEKETLQWQNFKATSDDLVLKGKIDVKHFPANSAIVGSLQLAPLDLKKWLQDHGQDMNTIQTLKNVAGTINFNPVPHSIALQGKFTIGQVSANNVKLSNVVVPLSYQNGVLTLNSVNAAFYQGKWNSNIKIDLNAASPRFSTTTTLSHINIAALMQDLSPKHKLTLSGDGNIDMQLTSRGNDKKTILKNLNGSGHFSLTRGVLHGMDINYLLTTAASIATHQVPSLPGNSVTDFDGFKGSYAIKNGIVNNNDLVMNSAQFTSKGQGSINLVNQSIDYHLQILLNQTALAGKKQLLNLYGLPIPVLISGNLTNPHVGLDQKTLAKEIAVQQVQKVGSKVIEHIEKANVPIQAGKFLHNLLTQ